MSLPGLDLQALLDQLDNLALALGDSLTGNITIYGDRSGRITLATETEHLEVAVDCGALTGDSEWWVKQ